MILNVSGRTDIVAFYTPWFLKRYHEGFVDVRNPFYPRMVSRIYFKDVDAIIFCTKNPLPILKHLKEINKPIIFQVTLTPYKNDIEPNVIAKPQIIEAIKKLSSIVGIDNLYIRYDPIFLSPKYNLEYHLNAFDKLCNLLNGYVKHFIISFIDNYKNVQKNLSTLKLQDFTEYDYQQIGQNFSNSAKKHNMTVQTCFEQNDLTQYGFLKSACLSKEMAFKLTGKKFRKWQARNCGCVEMVDIGVYNSCQHFCKYCYANYDEKFVNQNVLNHDANSSLLVGKLQKDDIIKVRKP